MRLLTDIMRLPQRFKETKFFQRYVIRDNVIYRTARDLYKFAYATTQRLEGNYQYEDYLGKDEKFYFRTIAHWRNKHYDKKVTLAQIADEMGRVKTEKNRDENTIAIIIEHVTPRLIKIVTSLKKKNYILEAYYWTKVINFSNMLDMVKSIVDNWNEYESVTELMAKLYHSKAFIAHYFTIWRDAGNACVIIQEKQFFPPVIVERYDVLNGMFANIPEDILAHEKYALENADGVIFREFAGEYLEKEMGFIIKRYIVFLDYFDECKKIPTKDNYDVNNIYNQKIGKLSLVYAGGINTEEEYPDASTACWLELADMCERNHCHIHIYPSVYDEIKFEKYIKLDRSRNYFHFHKPVPYRTLIEELSQYDYGIMPVRDDVYLRPVNGYNSINKLIYTSTNKVFDYIAAGLPIILYSPQKLGEMLEKYGISFRWPIEKWDFDELRIKYGLMKKNVYHHRHDFCIDSHIDRLIDFYHMVYEKVKNEKNS